MGSFDLSAGDKARANAAVKGTARTALKAWRFKLGRLGGVYPCYAETWFVQPAVDRGNRNSCT